eukprot:5492458-Prymnesium_polylepis.2
MGARGACAGRCSLGLRRMPPWAPRANLEHDHGGRFVQVTRSTRDEARGPYGPFELLQIGGYDPLAGNIYFAAVKREGCTKDSNRFQLNPWMKSLPSR